VVGNAHSLLLIGSILLLALSAHWVGQRIHVPRVTLLLLLGALAGPELFDLLPANADEGFTLVTNLALAMVGFLLGERMSLKELRSSHGAISVSLAVTLATALFVFLASWLITDNLAASLLLAGIAPATAPAATLDVIREAGADGPLTRLVWQVVAIDDAWCVILFSVLLVSAEMVTGNTGALSGISAGLGEVVGSILLGLALGFPMAWLTGRLRPGEPTLLEAAGFVFVAAGLASLWELSYLLTCMTLGAVVANVARHHLVPFRSIEGVAEPFLAIFFFLAGYELDWGVLKTLGALGAAYVSARVLGRLVGGWLGAWIANTDHQTRRHIGLCLMPQAGVALGLALVAIERVPHSDFILPLVIDATVVFELVGPPVTLMQLRRAGEVHTGA
jgi:Kef-type K+ transport system membrane component KefB